ncbi:SDR family oxidoreductase [Salibacter halophilus]|uniref:SDR family oxidoreductase n=1 Tax=Salibacter halophilus TaxID=1803916 RepID=A0A6N6MAD9_9FLAO|nr:SDR family oxidoreductase [Salibacter halophilus]KAB1065226.1 SDR family oxidoreductase [Salibacter halophilus]
MKKVLIIGANGKVGKHITKKMKEADDFTPTALIRKEEQKSHFDDLGVDSKVVSLEDSVDKLKEAITGHDAIVFTAGSGGNTGSDKTLTVDLDGAVKTMEAAKYAGVDRYVMVSAMMADNREVWEKLDGMKPYYVAKHYADQFLKSSGLNYTILRPGLLLDEEGTGKIDIENPASKKGVPREDVAATVLASLRSDNSNNKIFEFNTGDTEIERVVS